MRIGRDCLEGHGDSEEGFGLSAEQRETSGEIVVLEESPKKAKVSVYLILSLSSKKFLRSPT